LPSLALSVVSALNATGLDTRRLVLEITETVLLQDDKAVLDTLHQIRALGVKIAMDDFGTGYSSLSYLRSFPFDKIKIDRSFISELGKRTTASPSSGGDAARRQSRHDHDAEAWRRRSSSKSCAPKLRLCAGLLFSRAKPASEIPGLLRTLKRLSAPPEAWCFKACRHAASAPLIGRRAHDQAVEFLRDLDLARQPRGRLHLEGEVEHVLFLGEGGPTAALQASSTCTRQVAQVQEPPHSATMLATSLRCAVSITVEPISASTVCTVPSCSM